MVFKVTDIYSKVLAVKLFLNAYGARQEYNLWSTFYYKAHDQRLYVRFKQPAKIIFVNNNPCSYLVMNYYKKCLSDCLLDDEVRMNGSCYSSRVIDGSSRNPQIRI
jgi:hypothetical protein